VRSAPLARTFAALFAAGWQLAQTTSHSSISSWTLWQLLRDSSRPSANDWT
jgi:hypothetical protein